MVETFDNIADAYKRLRRLQDQDIQNKLRNDSLSPAQVEFRNTLVRAYARASLKCRVRW
jgi:RNA polymerase primary sigma factor